MDMQERIDTLKRHGYKIRYASPRDAYDFVRLSWTQVSEYSEYPGDVPFVELRDCVSEDRQGYGGTFRQQSNFRSLERDYAATVVRIGYSNSDTLGFFVHSVSDDFIHLACRLTDGAIYDESDWSELEDEAVRESFAAWLHSDLYRDMPEWAQDLDFEFNNEDVESEFWSLITDEQLWDTERGALYECYDSEVSWDMDAAQEILIRALRNLKRRALGRTTGQKAA